MRGQPGGGKCHGTRGWPGSRRLVTGAQRPPAHAHATRQRPRRATCPAASWAGPDCCPSCGVDRRRSRPPSGRRPAAGRCGTGRGASGGNGAAGAGRCCHAKPCHELAPVHVPGLPGEAASSLVPAPAHAYRNAQAGRRVHLPSPCWLTMAGTEARWTADRPALRRGATRRGPCPPGSIGGACGGPPGRHRPGARCKLVWAAALISRGLDADELARTAPAGGVDLSLKVTPNCRRE